MRPSELFNIHYTIAEKLIKSCETFWEVLPEIEQFIRDLGQSLSDSYVEISPEIWVEKTATVAASATLQSPCVIDAKAEIRPGAYIRGSAIVGKHCVVGNSTELKNCILFDGVQVPHYNYVGDSILGYKAHMGAGSVTSNVKNDKSNVCVTLGGERVDTGLRKFGAMIGDHSEIGCNSVLNPGTIIGKCVSVYPTSNVRGTIPARHIYKSADVIVSRE